jgi:hypothetical protein
MGLSLKGSTQPQQENPNRSKYPMPNTGIPQVQVTNAPNEKILLLAEMTRTGEINERKSTPNWQKAMLMFMAATGNREVNLNCNSCYNKIANWLKQ